MMFHSMNAGNAQVHGCYPSGISLWVNQDGFVVLTVSREYMEHGINLCQASQSYPSTRAALHGRYPFLM